jgi:ankyrin repeat protein
LCRIGKPNTGGEPWWDLLPGGVSKWDLQPGRVCPPLFYCASLASLWPTRYLVENGEIIDEVTDYDGAHNGFALQNAIMERNTEIAKFLLHRGANANAQGGLYGNALQAAVVSGDTEIIQLLLDKAADVNAQGGFYGNILQAAAFRSDTEIIQLLLDRV